MGRVGSCDMIRWERSYWFSTPGQFFVGFCFLMELKQTVWKHTLKSLTQLLITPTPQVNQELSCWKNYEEEEGFKAGKDEDWGGDFSHIESRRDQWEDQGGKNQKDEEGASYIVLFITHCFCNCPFSRLVVSAYLIHGVHIVKCRWGLLRNSHICIGKYVPLIRLSTL